MSYSVSDKMQGLPWGVVAGPLRDTWSHSPSFVGHSKDFYFYCKGVEKHGKIMWCPWVLKGPCFCWVENREETG